MARDVFLIFLRLNSLWYRFAAQSEKQQRVEVVRVSIAKSNSHFHALIGYHIISTWGTSPTSNVFTEENAIYDIRADINAPEKNLYLLDSWLLNGIMHETRTLMPQVDIDTIKMIR